MDGNTWFCQRSRCYSYYSGLDGLYLRLFVAASPYGNLEDLYSADYEDYDEHNEVSEEAGGDAILKPPEFVSSGLDLVVNEGEVIRLPCIVSRYEVNDHISSVEVFLISTCS